MGCRVAHTSATSKWLLTSVRTALLSSSDTQRSRDELHWSHVMKRAFQTMPVVHAACCCDSFIPASGSLPRFSKASSFEKARSIRAFSLLCLLPAIDTTRRSVTTPLAPFEGDLLQQPQYFFTLACFFPLHPSRPDILQASARHHRSTDLLLP